MEKCDKNLQMFALCVKLRIIGIATGCRVSICPIFGWIFSLTVWAILIVKMSKKTKLKTAHLTILKQFLNPRRIPGEFKGKFKGESKKNPRRIQEKSKKNPRKIQEKSKKNPKRIWKICEFQDIGYWIHTGCLHSKPDVLNSY